MHQNPVAATARVVRAAPSTPSPLHGPTRRAVRLLPDNDDWIGLGPSGYAQPEHRGNDGQGDAQTADQSDPGGDSQSVRDATNRSGGEPSSHRDDGHSVVSMPDYETDSDSDFPEARARPRGPPQLTDEGLPDHDHDEHRWATPPPPFPQVNQDSSPPYVRDPHLDQGSNLANVRSDRQLAPVPFSLPRHAHTPGTSSRNSGRRQSSEGQQDREEEPLAPATDAQSTRRMSGNPSSSAREFHQLWLSGRCAY